VSDALPPRVMGGIINTLAFPAPQLHRGFYEDELLSRKDLVWLTTSQDEKIPAVHVKNEKTGLSWVPEQDRLILLYSHGNAEDIGLHLDLIDELSLRTGTDVFSYEYVGYSLSRLAGDSPSEEGCNRSIEAAWKYLVEDLKVHPNRIVIYGRSIGSGPAVDLASRESVPGCRASPLDVRGVLLQSPIESGARAIFGHGVSLVGYYMDPFRNYQKIGKIRCPVAIMHGTCDEVVPCQNGRNLHDLAQRPFEPLWMEGYGHNNMPQTESFNYTKRFVDSLLTSPNRA